MLYFKHSELVAKYHVSLKTIHNWIDAAKQERINLQLYEMSGRTYIANTGQNNSILDHLAENGKKYRNALHHRIVKPDPAFYSLYSRKQILDIISNLTIYKEIPCQYNYFGSGAKSWEKYAERLWSEESPNVLRNTVDLLDINLDVLDALLEGYDRVNIIDIGPGNALPIKNVLEHFASKGMLHRYIALDISQSMLHIAERNIHQWFGDTVRFEGHVRDITHERFDDLLVDDMFAKDAPRTVNIALMLGGTPMNFPAPLEILKVIRHSIGPNDLFLYSDRPDSEMKRRSFGAFEPGVKTVAPRYNFIYGILSFVFSLLNIDESLYTVEMGYNEQKRMRFIQIKFNVAVTIRFAFEGSERDVLFDKGEAILLLRVWHKTTAEFITEFEQSGFSLLQASLTKDGRHFLTISSVSKPQLF